MSISPYNFLNNPPRGPFKPILTVDGQKDIPKGIDQVRFLHTGTQGTGAHTQFQHINTAAAEVIFNYGPAYELQVDTHWQKINTGDLYYIPQGKPHGPIRLGPGNAYQALNVEIASK